MLVKIQKSLSSFMKKQINQKSTKTLAHYHHEHDAKHSPEEASAEAGEEIKAEEDKSEEEKAKELDEAKKASRNKAGERDQVEMFKKLLIQNIMKYTLLIAVLTIFAIGTIKSGPAIVKFFNGFLSKILMGGLRK